MTSRFNEELLGTPTPVMEQYLHHFMDGAHQFLNGLEAAAVTWDNYTDSGAAGPQNAPVNWSSAYFLNSINAALISTRLFLQGYIVPSGNLARHAVESLAFGVLLPFPATGAYRDWNGGRDIEYKSLERLARSAVQCGIKSQNIDALRKQAKWFDKYSHPSRLVLASGWVTDTGWNLGALFDNQKLPEYTKEMANRISMTRLLNRTIAGTHRELIAQKRLIGKSAR